MSCRRAAADVGGQRAVDEHDQRADRAGRAAAAGAFDSPVAGHFSIVPYGLAGSVAASTTTSGFVRRLAERAQQIERRRQRELRRADAADEVAAPDPAGVLQRLEHVVDRAEAAGIPSAPATSRVSTP